MKSNPKVVVVLGPTASGKSDFAVEYALKHNGEIISADSRQLYKGLDIGTGKITEEEMKGVKHHMLSLYDLNEGVSVVRYRSEALLILKDIIARGKTPIVCGGTGQYIDALIYETAIPGVPPNKKLRESLEKKSTDELFSDLMIKDNERAQAIDKHNRVRVIRALEIIQSLGTVPKLPTPKLRYPTEIYRMAPDRELLRTRVTKRIEKRIAQGMIEEVAGVMNHGYTSGEMSRFGLEYVVIGKFLEGEYTKGEMRQVLTNKCMQYAKRQETWNKKYTEATPVPVTE
jgi:tRNA dimethylallyltransferase